MIRSTAEIRELILFAKREGVTHLKIGELEFHVEPSVTRRKRVPVPEVSKIPVVGLPPEDMDMLMWSAPDQQIEYQEKGEKS